MKVLWFANNTVGLNKKENTGGWMQILEYELCKDEKIHLNIATRYNGKDIRRIENLKTTYFLIPEKRNLFQKRIDILFNREPIEEYIKEYLKVIEIVEPDIIHIFGTELDYGLLCSLTGIPVVIHIQGVLHPCYYQIASMRLSFIQNLRAHNFIDYIKGSTFKNNLKIFKRRVAVEEKIFKVCKYFIGRTAWDNSIINLLAPKAVYYHCEEMLRQDFLIADWCGNDDEVIHIVSTISNPLYKGHETLVATCLLLKKVGVSFLWHIIGLDDKKSSFRIFYKNYMKSLAGDIQLYGMLTETEIVKILQFSDIYVHPSHIENSSNALCEAMAVGMPVVALFVGGNVSIVKDGEDGLLVSDNDPYILAETIKRLAENKVESRKIANAAKIRARKRHDPKWITAEMMNIYSDVIKRHASE